METSNTTTKRYGAYFVALLAAVAIVASPVEAVVIRDVPGGPGTGNTTAPPDDPGWDNFGTKGNGTSCIYLGQRWVLTAAHARVADNVESARFGGVTYNMVPGSGRFLHDPDDPGINADLSMFRIDADPGLPGLTISSTSPPDGAAVVAMGNGRSRAAAETSWGVVEDPVGVFTWTEGGTDKSGFMLISSRSRRWGENEIEESGVQFDGAGYTTRALETIFDPFGVGNANEMQVATGDSGGGMFYKNNGNWELAGILIATKTYAGQPDAVVYGNLSVAADLSRYYGQITSPVPEPSSLVMLAVGTGFLAWWSWRRRRAGRGA